MCEPDGSKVYVSSHDSIRVINTFTNAVIAIIPVSDNPSFITITPMEVKYMFVMLVQIQ